MYLSIRPLLFYLEPELAHALTLSCLHFAEKVGLLKDKVWNYPVEAMGLRFPNPIGIAAGLDKNAVCVDGLLKLGVGFLELGSVTLKPRMGNSKPRVFRLPEYSALINRMQLPNVGVLAFMQNLRQAKRERGIIGINISKSLETSADEMLEEYTQLFNHVAELADYVTINVSCPNEPALRAWQMGAGLVQLLRALKAAQQKQVRHVPLVLKVSPDLNTQELKQVANCALNEGIEGVIATNTTLSRDGIQGHALAQEAGGLSGAPLFSKALHAVEILANALQGRLPIIGLGGIMSADDLKRMQSAGASLFQIYTALIYRGPDLIKELVDVLIAD